MAKYIPYSYEQGQLISVIFAKQILPGTFEFALNQLIDEKIDLTCFDQKFSNDKTGAPAYDPRILLKIILFAYSRGIIHSREIEACCKNNIIFMALSAHSRPHFTTIANFISSMDKEIIPLFQKVLLVCDKAGLIGREMFAIDGCKLPSNASKEFSGTTDDFKKKASKIKTTIEKIVHRHKSMDCNDPIDIKVKNRELQQIETLDAHLQKIEKWLESNEDRRGKSGNIVKSNITDNDSAKMKTSKGVIQGYNGLSVVDSTNQIIVSAQAYGHSHEQATLKPMIGQTRENFIVTTNEVNIFSNTTLTADSGFHSEDNMEMLAMEEIDAYIADPKMRSRDPRFDNADRFKTRSQKERKRRNPPKNKFKTEDFIFEKDLTFCTCPAGEKLNGSCNKVIIKNYEYTKFKGSKSICGPCKLRSQCLQNHTKTAFRQVSYPHGKSTTANETFTDKMKQKIDTKLGRFIYSRRVAVAEPPFAQIRHILGLNRFTLRGKKKVNIQWNLYCIIHNLRRWHNCTQSMVT
jgi:transposase